MNVQPLVCQSTEPIKSQSVAAAHQKTVCSALDLAQSFLSLNVCYSICQDFDQF